MSGGVGVQVAPPRWAGWGWDWPSKLRRRSPPLRYQATAVRTSIAPGNTSGPASPPPRPVDGLNEGYIEDTPMLNGTSGRAGGAPPSIPHRGDVSSHP